MSRRRPDKRGRHKKHSSPETLAWQRLHPELPRPAWMTPAAYNELRRLQHRLELDDDRT